MRLLRFLHERTLISFDVRNFIPKSYTGNYRFDHIHKEKTSTYRAGKTAEEEK